MWNSPTCSVISYPCMQKTAYKSMVQLCSRQSCTAMATYCDIDSVYSSSGSDIEEEDAEIDHWRRSYPGASLYFNDFVPIEPKTKPAQAASSSDGQLCSRISPELELAQNESYSKAFKTFTAKIRKTVTTYHFLDPSQSKQFVRGKYDLDSSGMVMLQGALINAVANWEEFIVEILKEGFAVFIEVGSGSPPNLQTLRKSLPSCDLILKRELRQSCQAKPVDELTYNLLCSVNAPQCSSPWAEHFESYCSSTITGAQLVPIFSPSSPNSIDTLFTKLFQVSAGCSLTEQLLKIGRFRFKLRLNQDDEIDLQIHSVSALRNISRLYYALRCVFAHGHNQKTMTGALKDFPRTVSEFDLGNERAAKYYLGLYRRMEKYGRDTSISYLTFINMTEFLKRAAFFLMRALAKWVYDSTDACVWNYKPHTQ